MSKEFDAKVNQVRSISDLASGVIGELMDTISDLRGDIVALEDEKSSLEDRLYEAEQDIRDLENENEKPNLLYGADCRIEEPWTPSVADSLVHPLDERFASQPWNRSNH
jgi:hypothetical protein